MAGSFISSKGFLVCEKLATNRMDFKRLRMKMMHEEWEYWLSVPSPAVKLLLKKLAFTMATVQNRELMYKM